ncbi:type II toxin-antitoxin system VapB family antitoxin [Thermostichus vulcanus]|uniref:Type II toxin-antitoxin system VapB family antitoxin n=1 Tax=Thermostichus vulcanus str. 'Rupite' TaxID=2813851 RepID=A0ABT0CB41_THEVL|nr:type II toxin-antitoxin system VapB family antitoxin [Thermostichus vulcanus]MCJ2542990.1 type II toxin-antitoxin system VapB family antitoxin [Thermostichus vulcanus str. 'Rupite']
MRTNIVIDDDLMKAALQATGLKTKREVVELGLRTLVQLQRQADIRQWRGRLLWEGDLEAMRTDIPTDISDCPEDCFGPQP